jgi:hypothetical protein
MHGHKRQSNKQRDSVKKRKAKRFSEINYRITRQNKQKKEED